MRTLTVVALILATTVTASAAPYVSPASLPQNQQPQTEARYQAENQLAEVRLDAARDRRTVIQLPANRSLDYLELRAGRAPITLADVEVRFADGTSIHTGSRGIVQPFQGRVIDLTRGSAPVAAIIPRFDTGRFGARLEVFGVAERRWHHD